MNYDSQALTIEREVGDRDAEARTLYYMGNIYSQQGDNQKALGYYEQALPIFRTVGDRDGEASVIMALGITSEVLGEKQKALDYYNQALPVFRAIGDRDGEARTLNNMGEAYSDLGDESKALDYDNQALNIFQVLGTRHGAAYAQKDIGTVYFDLGEKQMALDSYSHALAEFREVGDRDLEATMLLSLGNVELELRENQKALDYYNQALPVLHEVGDQDNEATVLDNLGIVYFELGEDQKSLDSYSKALPIYRAVEDRSGEAHTLTNLGVLYSRKGDRQRALGYFNQALPIQAALTDPLYEAETLYELLRNEKDAQPSLAIFHGKQAINLLQQVRGNISGLDKELTKSFLDSRETYYHDLANLLIDQGRLPEAQQVLDLLKVQEYTDYVRGDPAKMLGSLSLTPAEQQAEEDYQKSTAQLVTKEKRWDELKQDKARTPDEDREYAQLSDALNSASRGMSDYYGRLHTLFSSNSSANQEVADIKGDTSLLRQQIAKLPHTVALYTVVSQDRYSVIVIAGAAPMVGRKYDIAEKDLNQKIAAFQQTLRDPHKDPHPAAQELYKILIGPVQADLDQAQAETLVWSLDGALRYVPISALYDGKQYIVEKYNIVSFTPASIAYLGDSPSLTDVHAAAMGIAGKYDERLSPLPNVARELDEIVSDPQAKEAHGVLPGSILLDGQFTEKAMEGELDGQHTIVHIASHFVFKPGDDTNSWLLLAGKDTAGTGYELTVAEFRDNQKLSLDGTDLLTLSACETGISGNAANGREVDGLATTAQLKGAKAVISSLWEVNDASTGELMADFYRRWAEGGGKVTKVEALRMAQLDLLLGKTEAATSEGARGLKAETPGTQAETGFKHPYYWAPFILMGNWR